MRRYSYSQIYNQEEKPIDTALTITVPSVRKHCATCGLPIIFAWSAEDKRRSWIHDAALFKVLARALALGVPVNHNTMRRRTIPE